ncbi:MAG: hypothetical protein JO316_13850 [Abitibacteriaceae bacterium]|nr:hypothetical protein [Abditibacteriaceae bacterium]
MLMASSYPEVLSHFEDKHVVTIATGATCAYLGDERNLREFLVADEAVRWLRRIGHTALFLLIDDSMDPLNFRQLRVAVNKDEALIEKYKDCCGKPISRLTDPWGCHESYAAHFEEELMDRLHRLDCHPTLITTAKLYERGVYKPYVRTALERYDEILEFLRTRFQGYEPEKLFWVLCPQCGYIHETDIEYIKDGNVCVYCHACEHSQLIPIDEIEGKLNWKLDCAARWALFKIDAEPFNKSYLEPQSGSFVVAQALSQEFFGGHPVLPLLYGVVKMEKQFGGQLLSSLPSTVFRSLLVERPASDAKISKELMITTASRYVVMPGVSFLDFIKQLLPMWLVTPETLTPDQRELVAHGISFSRYFLDTEVRLQLPTPEQFEGEQIAVLNLIHVLLNRVLPLRQRTDLTWEQFQEKVKAIIDSLGSHKGPALHRLRLIVGQEQGLPAARFLYMLPMNYLQLLESILKLYLQCAQHTARNNQDESEDDDSNGARHLRVA